jgi:hypothetical protein
MLGKASNGVILALAGRENELRFVLDVCQALSHNVLSSPPPSLIFFSGWRGMGKSRFLQELAMQTKPANFITLSLTSNRNSDVWLELDDFFKTLALQMNEFFDLEGYNRLVNNRHLRNDQDGMSLRANTITNDLLRWYKSTRRIVLLLHDNVSSKAFQWLSKFFYKKLFDHSALCVVATGETSPTVSSLSLLPYFYSDTLKPLNQIELNRILARFDFDSQIRADLIKFSAGNPGCLNEGVSRLTSKYEGSIAWAMAKYLLKDLPESIAQCCLYLAPLRSFNHDIMSLLLPEVLPPDSPIRQYGAADFLRLGRELNDRVDFIEAGQNYFMQSAARQILTFGLVHFTQEENPLGLIHQKAADYYRDLIIRLKPEQRLTIAVEHIYHVVNYQLVYRDRVNFSLHSFDYLKPLLGEASLFNQLADLVRQEPDLSPYLKDWYV